MNQLGIHPKIKKTYSIFLSVLNEYNFSSTHHLIVDVEVVHISSPQVDERRPNLLPFEGLFCQDSRVMCINLVR